MRKNTSAAFGLHYESNSALDALLKDYPNPANNVFLMMRFQDKSYHDEIVDSVREELKYYGLNCLRADDKSYSTLLWTNVESYMNGCNLGIAVFEQIDEQDFNPNVSLEVGYMLAAKKHVLLLKEQRLKTLLTDIVGHFYRTFDSHNIMATLRPGIRQWLRDVGIAKSPTERIVLFVSHGGTCRCAMAKIALTQALKRRCLPYQLRIVSVAGMYASTQYASKGARMAVCNAYGTDLLASHRVTQKNPGLLAEADLILAMEDSYVDDAGLPKEKSCGFKTFFGMNGDIKNPWPDMKDNADTVAQKYTECMREIRDIIDGNYQKILTYLEDSCK